MESSVYHWQGRAAVWTLIEDWSRVAWAGPYELSAGGLRDNRRGTYGPAQPQFSFPDVLLDDVEVLRRWIRGGEVPRDAVEGLEPGREDATSD